MKTFLLNSRMWYWHLLFWSCLFLYEWLLQGSLNDCYGVSFRAAVLNVPIIMMVTYFSIFITVERFLLQKKYLSFALCLVGSMIFAGVFRRIVTFDIIYKVLYPERAKTLFLVPKILIDAVYVQLIAGLGSMIYVIRKWMEQQRINEKLTAEKVAAELALLRSQVQPHFIFNTLNNIYMLSLKNSPLTSDMIHRLSALLSYMLYDSKRSLIEVEKEINYIKDYINLEKIRYGTRLDIQISGANTTKGVQVPPLLFLPLVENAFKHGVSNAVEDSWIHVDISLKKQVLVFKIENSLSDDKIAPNGFGNGLGLDNLKKRLEILYPDSFELKFLKEEDSYLAVLKLDFTEYTAKNDIFTDYTEGSILKKNRSEKVPKYA
ncbi:MAG: histidine kinase [Saprospiraceae bacterium]|nr:histidine kinase [Saprospiraceae bacterium]